MLLRLCAALAVCALPLSAAAAEGDATAGKKIFKKCGVCHFVDKEKKKIGPSLKGVIGRTAGTWDKYKYSKAMKAAGEGGLTWSEETLAEYLIKPKKLVPGTKMAFPGLKKPEDRLNVIAYIKTFSPPPAE
ncbi:MAG: c-type cytochrome [Hyphomicrobiales bacterium]